MKAVQTIELSDDERLVLSKALRLINQISDVTNISMCEVFDYFLDSETDDGQYSVKALHNIEEMRGEV